MIAVKRRLLTPGLLLLLYCFVWFMLNLLILADYPFMHSDEPWLSGLSRQIMSEGRLDVTEPFYDLHKRHPHAIKILFHLGQIVFIKILGYSLYSVRFFSLTGGFLCLIGINSFFRNLTGSEKSEWFSLVMTIWFSLDIQFIYASHTARQEIFLLLLMILSCVVLQKGKGYLPAAVSALLTGIAIGFHPNAFLVAWPAGLYLLTEIIRRRRSAACGAVFLIIAAGAAAFFLWLSFCFNSHFIRDYLTYGSSLGVTETPDIKLLRWPGFHQKLFTQKGGTYYLPDIRWQYISLPFFLLMLLLPGRSQRTLIFCGLIGINIGLMILGKYSQPSIIFLFPFYYGAAAAGIVRLKFLSGPLTRLLPILLTGVTILFTSMELRKELNRSNENYADYISQISETLPPDSVCLGNLTLEYYLENGNLYHWRNLENLPDKGDTDGDSPLSGYIRSRGINRIVVPAEILYIYRSRPVWNVLYGNPAHWYPQLEQFLEEECRLEAEFPSPGYGIRIASFRNSREWPVKIYKVIPEDSR